MEPQSLGAERFRALATRLENLRLQNDFKSLQVTSAGINEGKTLIAANLAMTLSRHSGSRVLLIEGDLHRPTLASLLGLTHLRGMSHWWSGTEEDLAPYVHRLGDMPLCFVAAGATHDQPSQILQSGRFSEALKKLASRFDWMVVDSTPMSPVVDANLWSRLVDVMLLVVREGITPIKELKKGLAALDNPKLVGVVLNDASEFNHLDYDQYYAAPKDLTNSSQLQVLSWPLLHFEKARAWLKADMQGSNRQSRKQL
jgi:capsular exopolysaccharide synthesis family protein